MCTRRKYLNSPKKRNQNKKRVFLHTDEVRFQFSFLIPWSPGRFKTPRGFLVFKYEAKSVNRYWFELSGQKTGLVIIMLIPEWDGWTAGAFGPNRVLSIWSFFGTVQSYLAISFVIIGRNLEFIKNWGQEFQMIFQANTVCNIDLAHIWIMWLVVV